MRDSGYYHDHGWKDTINIWNPNEPEGYGAFSEIPVLSDFNGLCAICEETIATKNIYYERRSFNLTKRFNEQVCEDCCNECMNDGDYLEGKKNIKVTKI